jgi:hypothetical protein
VDDNGTRSELHRLCTHVLARRRYEVTGHFGLRASPGGIATPAFGDEPEVLRVAAGQLVREVGNRSSSMPIDGASLRDLAAFAGTDLGAAFSAGNDTPPLDDVHRPVRLRGAELDALVDWYDLGSRVLDAVLAGARTDTDAATVQLWPEHFDIGTVLPLAGGGQVNLGFSPGDGAIAEPYAYVGPWTDDRPGDASYWNVPFGAALTRSAVTAADAGMAEAECIAFMRRGLELLSPLAATPQRGGRS